MTIQHHCCFVGIKFLGLFVFFSSLFFRGVGVLGGGGKVAGGFVGNPECIDIGSLF